MRLFGFPFNFTGFYRDLIVLAKLQWKAGYIWVFFHFGNISAIEASLCDWQNEL